MGTKGGQGGNGSRYIKESFHYVRSDIFPDWAPGDKLYYRPEGKYFSESAEVHDKTLSSLSGLKAGCHNEATQWLREHGWWGSPSDKDMFVSIDAQVWWTEALLIRRAWWLRNFLERPTSDNSKCKEKVRLTTLSGRTATGIQPGSHLRFAPKPGDKFKPMGWVWSGEPVGESVWPDEPIAEIVWPPKHKLRDLNPVASLSFKLEDRPGFWRELLLKVLAQMIYDGLNRHRQFNNLVFDNVSRLQEKLVKEPTLGFACWDFLKNKATSQSPQRLCKECGKLFRPGRSHAKSCGAHKCKKAAQRARKKLRTTD